MIGGVDAGLLWGMVLSAWLIYLEELTVYLLALSFAPLKRPRQVWWTLILTSLVQFMAANFLRGSGAAAAVVHVMLSFTVNAVMICRLFQCPAPKAMALSMLASVYLMAVDFLYMSLLFSVFTFEEQQTHLVIGYTFCFMAKLVEPGVVVLFYRWRSHRRARPEPDAGGWTLVLLFSCPMLLLTAAMTHSIWTIPNAARICLMFSALLIFVCVGVFFLMDYAGRRQTAERERTVLWQNLKLETAHVRSMTGRYTQQRAQAHDFKNQLAVLRGMAAQGAPMEEFAAYLDSLSEAAIPSVLYINTHRTVVDVILSEKVPAAREKGIDFQFQLDDLSAFPMTDDALVVVLTNLIDNAVEACEKIPAPADRRILLKMKLADQIALLGIENTTAEPVVILDNTVQTTKADPLAHGYGLRNVAAMIRQSGGMWFIEYREEDKVFSFSASLPRSENDKAPGGAGDRQEP